MATLCEGIDDRQHGGADLFDRGRDKLAGRKQTCENAEKLSHLTIPNGLRSGQALVSASTHTLA